MTIFIMADNPLTRRIAIWYWQSSRFHRHFRASDNLRPYEQQFSPKISSSDLSETMAQSLTIIYRITLTI